MTHFRSSLRQFADFLVLRQIEAMALRMDAPAMAAYVWGAELERAEEIKKML